MPKHLYSYSPLSREVIYYIIGATNQNCDFAGSFSLSMKIEKCREIVFKTGVSKTDFASGNHMPKVDRLVLIISMCSIMQHSRSCMQYVVLRFTAL